MSRNKHRIGFDLTFSVPMSFVFDWLDEHRHTRQTGMTAGVLRPLVGEIVQDFCTSALVLDGMDNIPQELAGLDGYTLIQPGRFNLNPMQGMSPSDVAAAIAAVGEAQ